MVKILKITDIEAITSIQENGKSIDIGAYRSLLAHPELRDFFLKDGAQLSLAMTALEPGCELPCHQHPMESLIIVVKGKGQYFGEFEQALFEGDIVKVPSHSLHGFKAAPDSYLECFSIQNDGKPIYGKENNRVSFEAKNFDILKNENEEKSLVFINICEQIDELLSSNEKEVRKVIFGYIKRWSECFQTIIFLRQANTLDGELSSIFLQHLEEEIGHQKYLQEYEYHFDALFEGFCAWFERKISIVSDVEKTILVHMVLETAGTIFSSTVGSEKNRNDKVSSYIELHSDLDEDHSSLGREHVDKYCQNNFESAKVFNSHCWDIFNAMFTYILDRAQEYQHKEKNRICEEFE